MARVNELSAAAAEGRRGQRESTTRYGIEVTIAA